jgi:hypothetical protein
MAQRAAGDQENQSDADNKLEGYSKGHGKKSEKIKHHLGLKWQ